MTKIATAVALIFTSLTFLQAQVQSPKNSYEHTFNELVGMLKGEKPLDFKRAVFITENTYLDNSLKYEDFCKQIDSIKVKLNLFVKSKGIGSNKMAKQYAIFSYLMEPQSMNNFESCQYDFEDYLAKKDRAQMFVTKLLRTKKGNCHSLPFLYKILAEEIKADAYLSLGPNHVYIKHRDDKGGWVNVELTNGGFPSDSWIISSLNITADAIKSGAYMDTLSLKQSVALCLFDLAQCYIFKYGHDNFGIKCCDALLNYYPNCIPAYMVKWKIHEAEFSQAMAKNENKPNKEAENLVEKVKAIDRKLEQLGYKEETKWKYENWVSRIEEEKVNKK